MTENTGNAYDPFDIDGERRSALFTACKAAFQSPVYEICIERLKFTDDGKWRVNLFYNGMSTGTLFHADKDTNPADIVDVARRVIPFFARGLDVGERRGVEAAQYRMRRALGLGEGGSVDEDEENPL